MTPPVEAPSPAMHPYQGTFSEEEIHDILGAMHDSTNADHEDSTQNNSEGVSHPGPTSTARAQARSERKRSREKQRREDVNKQFADLSALLRQIEEEEDENSKRLPYSTTNRVDLIARTIVLMERVHKVSKERKQEIVNLQKEVEDARKMAEDTAARLKEATLYQQPGPQKQVMMMVPMMVNPETMGQSGGFMAPQPYMQQPQMMMMPQIPQSGSNSATATPPPQQMQVQPQPQQQGPTQQMQPQQMQTQQQVHQIHSQQMQPQQMQSQQMQHMHGQMQMMPQMMPQFPAMMFQQPAQGAPVATAVPSVASAPQQQQQGQKLPPTNSSNNNNGGGNLAHCA